MKFVLPVGNLPLICRLDVYLTFGRLNSDPGNRRCTLYYSSLQLDQKKNSILVILKFIHTHFKFIVHGCKQAYTRTWTMKCGSSLMLAPINTLYAKKFPNSNVKCFCVTLPSLCSSSTKHFTGKGILTCHADCFLCPIMKLC